LARIAGVDLPRDKKDRISRSVISTAFGLSNAEGYVAEAGVDPSTRVRDLTESEIAISERRSENSYRVEGHCGASWL